VSGNYLYFAASTTANGEELWRIDQAGNLLRLTDINPLSGSSAIDIWGESNGTLYFTANNNIGFAGLWKTDGNSITQLPSASGAFTGVNSALNAGGTLYIAGTTTTTGTELFKTFGGSTPVLVKDIFGGSNSSSPQNLTDMNGTIFFSATTSAAGRELWKTDGTDPGTVLVKDIAPGSFDSSNPQNMAAANGILYFNATLTTTGAELWRSDGTAAGTYLLKDIFTGTIPGSIPLTGNSSAPSRLYANGGFVYFAADDGVNGRELWRTDGTPDGTILYADLYPENSILTLPALPAFFTAVGNEVFFRASDDNAGR
jgi:ELWxxDGT repeat protein